MSGIQLKLDYSQEILQEAAIRDTVPSFQKATNRSNLQREKEIQQMFETQQTELLLAHSFLFMPQCLPSHAQAHN